jgi:hypothetical protein
MKMKTQRIECPGCAQPIEIGLPINVGLKISLLISVIVILSLAGVLVMQSHKFKSAERDFEKQIAEVRVISASAAMRGTKTEIMDDINNAYTQMGLDVLDQETKNLERTLKGLPIESEDHLKLRLFEKRWNTISNSIASFPGDKVVLAGTVQKSDWDNAVEVESSTGPAGSAWPV